MGKSSIIDRYTTNRFEDAHNVLPIGSSPQLVLISMSKISIGAVRIIDYKCGIQQAKKGIVA